MRYFYHPESETYWTEEDEEEIRRGFSDGMSTELDREEYLEGLATQALWNALLNGGAVPDDMEDCAAEMVEHGVFGPTEDCLHADGYVLIEYVDAVRKARQGWVNR